MSPEAIVDIWENTADVFKQYDVPLTGQTLETLVEKELLQILLKELNAVIGSTTATCIEGG